MRAVRVHVYEEPPRLDRIEAPGPPQDGQLAIEVAAVGCGAWDQGVISGRLDKHVKPDRPFIMGAELAGRVTAVGAGSHGFAVGDRVMANPGIVGAWAERVVLDADRCGHAPRSVDDAHAAAVPVAGLTAWQALEQLGLAAEAALLILGAGGTVGRAAVQLAKARGYEIAALAGTEDADTVLALGARTALDRSGDWVGQATATAPDRFDGVLDVVGGETLKRALELVRPGGRVVTTLSEAAGVDAPDGIDVEFLPMRSRTADLEALAALVDAGRLTMPVAEVRALDEAPALLGDDGWSGDDGKLVLTT